MECQWLCVVNMTIYADTVTNYLLLGNSKHFSLVVMITFNVRDLKR